MMKAELPPGNMFVISLKGVGPTHPIKDDGGSSSLIACSGIQLSFHQRVQHTILLCRMVPFLLTGAGAYLLGL
jgi:hypothetical protein